MTKVREVFRDPLYRGSVILLTNTAILAALGFAFWTLAARDYPAATVGSFSGLSSGVGLVSGIASLGLPNMITRHLASSESPRGLLVIATTAITALGGLLCVIVLLGLGRFLPASLHLQASGWSAALFTALVILTSLNGAWSAGLVVIRRPQTVLWTNLTGSVAKLVLLIFLASMRSSGLIIAFSIGLVLSTLTSLPSLAARTPWGNGMSGSFAIFRDYLSVTVNNYIATIFGALPGTVVPLEIIAVRGAAQAAPFALASMLTGFLNIIPSTMSQLVFAEASRPGVSLGVQVRKAIRGIYAILVPLVLIAVLGAPFILRLFGSVYAAQGTASLRILALTTLVMSGNYLVDSVLISRDRGGAYLFMNGANAALVLGLVAGLLHRGIIGAAEGWSLAQALSLALGLAVLATGRTRTEAADSGVASAEAALAPDTLRGDRDRLERLRRTAVDLAPSIKATAPLMLSGIEGTDELIRGLSIRFNHSPGPARPRQGFAGPGEVTFFGLWFAPMTIPVGPRQVRRPHELPVLVAFNAYSGWLTALLIPSLHTQDILAGTWELLRRLGGMPRHAVWDPSCMQPELVWFFRSLGVNAIPAPPVEESMIQHMYAYIESRFIGRQAIYSPQQFNEQLKAWTESDNNHHADSESIPRALLAAADRQSMALLPPRRPTAAEWRIEAYVADRPFVEVDYNAYAVDPVAIGRKVLIVADLWRVDIYCAGRRVGAYRRSWAKDSVIGPRAHRHWQERSMRLVL